VNCFYTDVAEIQPEDALVARARLTAGAGTAAALRLVAAAATADKSRA
jgi:hypothetical protein